MIVILTIVLVLVAAISNAFMDLSSEGVLSGWWDKNTSWRNKWKLGEPANGPAFPGSTTIFVWVTDGWHLFQFVFHTCWQLAIAIQLDYWFWKFILIKTIFSGIFELIYSHKKQ